MSKVNCIVYPNDQDFQIQIGSLALGSRTYANSSNAYRGARAAMRNLLKNRFVSNDSNYGPETVAITNSNGFVIAANEYSRPSGAKQAVNKVLKATVGIKKLQLEVEKS